MKKFFMNFVLCFTVALPLIVCGGSALAAKKRPLKPERPPQAPPESGIWVEVTENWVFVHYPDGGICKDYRWDGITECYILY